MPSRVILLLAAICGLSLVAVPAARSEEIQRPALDAKDIEPLLRTEWFGLYLKDKKIGYVRSTCEQVGDQVLVLQTFNMKLASFGQKAEYAVSQVLTFENKAPYRMVRAEKDERNEPAPPKKTLLLRKGQGFEYSYRTGQEVSRKQIADVDYTLADALASDLWVRRGPKQGDKAVFKQFDVTDGKTHALKCKILGTKSSLVAGVKVRYFEVEIVSSKEQLTYLTRLDDQGRTLSSVIAIFEIRAETEEQAKNTEYSQDLFVLGMVKSDRPLGLTKSVRELVLEVPGKEGEIFEDGPRQSVAPGPNGSRLLKLGKKYGKATPATREEIADSLEETNSYCISHPKVKALAEQAVGSAKTPEEKVRRIVRFVNGFIRPQLSATMPTIHDLMENKHGDCKSYALMVTNLARAAGVPAREVSGLLYIGDDQKAFGGHAWNEVVLNGVWVPVDASLRETEVDATHVSFGTEHKAAKNLLTTMGKLSFKVVEVQNGK